MFPQYSKRATNTTAKKKVFGLQGGRHGFGCSSGGVGAAGGGGGLVDSGDMEKGLVKM